MLQCGARGAVRLGEEVCVHVHSFPYCFWKRREGNHATERWVRRMERQWAERPWRRATDNLSVHYTAALINTKNKMVRLRKIPKEKYPGNCHVGLFWEDVSKMTDSQNILIPGVNTPLGCSAWAAAEQMWLWDIWMWDLGSAEQPEGGELTDAWKKKHLHIEKKYILFAARIGRSALHSIFFLGGNGWESNF